MKHVRQALIGIERNSMSIKSNCYMFHSDVKCVREQEVMLIFFRAKVSLFGSDEILLNYASILRDERNYTMVSCLGRKNRAGGECFGERDRGREGGVGEIWKRESVPHFSRLDPPSCLLRVWDIFLFLSLWNGQ